METASGSTKDLSSGVRHDGATDLRLLGLLPLAFFIAQLSFYWRNGGMENILWMCNVGNLALAAGLLLGVRWMIRVAVLWLIPGLPLWLYYETVNGGWLVTSFLTHFGGLIVGLCAVYKNGAGRLTWLHAFVFFLIFQQLSRRFTPPAPNVNVAHIVPPGWEGMFHSYRAYWLTSTLTVALTLWGLGQISLFLFPPRDPY